MNTSLSYEINYIKPHFIKVVANGVADANKIANMYQDIINQSHNYGCKHILFNSTNFESKYPLVELLPLVRRVKPSFSGFKMARVCNVHEHRQGFIETVVQKENLNIKNFHAENDAVNWLLESNI